MCSCQLDELHKDTPIGKWIDGTFGGVRALRIAIMQDFFRSAFDGSGADNFFDVCCTAPLRPVFLPVTRLSARRIAAAAARC